jgi:hypothetical protein
MSSIIPPCPAFFDMPHINKKMLNEDLLQCQDCGFWDMMQCSMVEKHKHFGGTIFRVENECNKFL